LIKTNISALIILSQVPGCSTPSSLLYDA